MLLKNEDTASGSVPWHVVDARQSIEDVHAQIASIVDQVISEAETKPIGKLWLK